MKIPPLFSRAIPVLAGLLLSFLALPSQATNPTVEDPAGLDFARDIEPLFAARCLKCHGEKKQKAGLRLDSKSAAMAGSDFGSRVVIVPGDAQASVLWERVSTDDEDDRMPPSGEPLDAQQLDALRRWIDAGASWPADEEPAELFTDHWAYNAPVLPDLPQPSGADWARNEIDLFVLERLQLEGLQPAPEAQRATLLRRLCLDLTGLPPTLEQIAAFEADSSEDAYEQLVEQLLASPHYGERQARAWLDLARYADTNGYEKDARRSMWRYRDWVIDAYNADMGFDQFTIEQIAGDLLPDASVAQRTATGFHRNTMINAEGGVDPEEYRVEAIVDRVNTTASVWLGSTMACARCHTHKYDPFSHRDYYRLFAYFNSTADVGPGDEPRLAAPTPAMASAEEQALAEIAALDAQLETWTPALEQELSELQQRRAAVPDNWQALRPQHFRSLEGTTLAMLEEGTLLAVGEVLPTDTYEVLVPVPAEGLQRLRIDVLPHPSLPHGGSARSEHQNFVLSEVELDLVGADGEVLEPLLLRDARADYHQTGSPLWPAADVVDGDPRTGWAIGGAVGVAHRIVIELESPVAAGESRALRVRLAQLYGSSHLIGHFGLSASAQSGDGLPPLPLEIEGLLARGDSGDEAGRAQLQQWFQGSAPSLAGVRVARAQLEKRPRPPTTLVMQELAVPRESHILERGSFLSPGAKVEPGVPMFLPQQPADAASNRLALARWLVRDDNPLTARVTINRLWAQVFGRGLVATPGDFGAQGERPTHPELLDWLALTFQADGWSTKSMLRRLVLSATYRQSSVASEELKARDPQNRLLARGARYRVEAEMVRDVALVASGLLTETVGGPSVFPPQPEGVWQVTYSNDSWKTATDGDRFRRGLYTFWRRTAPYPAFMAFDATSRELTCVRRPASNTPLQALALLNDPAFVEAAVALGARLLRAPASSDVERLERGFLLCTGRRAEPAELDVLVQLLGEERAQYLAHPAAAVQLIHSDAELGTADLDAAELAAWSVLANVLLNLDETITRS